jgi:hypothetical protein
MVDQAQVTASGEPWTNGRTELPPQVVARNSASFLADVTTLAELQGKLLIVDLQEGINKLIGSVALLIGGGAIALGCVPIALAALAVVLAETTRLSLAASFGVALLVGLLLAAALTIPALIALKKGLWMFERSRTEWRRNMQWLRDTMKRMGGQGGTCPPRAPTGPW